MAFAATQSPARRSEGDTRGARGRAVASLCALAVAAFVLEPVAAHAEAVAEARAEGVAAEQADNAQRGLSAAQKQALATAIERGEDLVVEAIVIAAIAQASGQVSEIIKDAIRIAPERAPDLVKAVRAAFPDLGDRAQTAASAVLESLKGGAAVAGVEPRPLGPAPGQPDATGAGEPPPPVPTQDLPEIEPPEHAWSGEFSVGGNLRTGVRRSVGANLGGEIEHRYADWENTVDGSFDYNRSDGETNTQRLRLQGKSKRKVSDRLYGFGLLGYEENRFTGFEYQLSEAVGIGYRVVDTDRVTWDLEAGPAWRQSRLTETGEFAKELFLRAGSDFAWIISDTAEFSNETSILYSGDKVEANTATSGLLQDSNDLTNVSALDMTVIGNLAARLSCEVSYTSEPPPGGVTTETLSKIALVHSF